VGDAAAVIGATGAIVPPRDADALGRGLVEVLQLPADRRAALGAAARARIEGHFSLAASTAQYVALYRSVHRGGLTPAGEASG
jgi:glycosyltransferase involved in cell wall biosynthesis